MYILFLITSHEQFLSNNNSVTVIGSNCTLRVPINMEISLSVTILLLHINIKVYYLLLSDIIIHKYCPGCTTFIKYCCRKRVSVQIKSKIKY